MKKHLLLIIAVLLTGIVKAQQQHNYIPPSTPSAGNQIYTINPLDTNTRRPIIYYGLGQSDWLAKYSDITSGFVPTNFLRINGSNANTDVNIGSYRMIASEFDAPSGNLTVSAGAGAGDKLFLQAGSEIDFYLAGVKHGFWGTGGLTINDYTTINNTLAAKYFNISDNQAYPIGVIYNSNSSGGGLSIQAGNTAYGALELYNYDHTVNIANFYANKASFGPKITGLTYLGTPSNDEDYTQKKYITDNFATISSLSGYLPLTGGTLTGGVTATSFTGAGTGLTGTASGLSIGGNAATATNSTQWGGVPMNWAAFGSSAEISYLVGYNSNYSQATGFSKSAVQGWLDLGSYAYRSSGLAELTASNTWSMPQTFSTGLTSNNTIAITNGFTLQMYNSANTFYSYFNPSGFTAVRQHTLPDASGTVALGTGSAGALAAWSSTNVLTTTTALPSGTTATTQSVGDNSTKVATTAYVDGALASGAPPKYNLSTTTDANYTITGVSDGVGQVVKLVTITANRTVSLPTASSFTGQQIIFFNYDTSGTNVWTISSGNAISGPSGGITTSLGVAGFVTKMISDGANWVVY